MYHANGKRRVIEQVAVGVGGGRAVGSRDAGAAGDPFEGLREGVRVDRSAFGVGERRRIVDADRVVFGGLEGRQPRQNCRAHSERAPCRGDTSIATTTTGRERA